MQISTKLHLKLIVTDSMNILKNTTFSMVLLNLNEVENANIPVDLILRNFKRSNQISIALNYDCKMTKDILNMVNSSQSIVSKIISLFVYFKVLSE